MSDSDCKIEAIPTLVINWKSWSFSSNVHTASSASSSLFFSFPSKKFSAPATVDSSDFSSSFIFFCSVFLSICSSTKSNCFSLFSNLLHLPFSLSFSFAAIVSSLFPFSSLARESFWLCYLSFVLCALSFTVLESSNESLLIKLFSSLITLVGHFNLFIATFFFL